MSEPKKKKLTGQQAELMRALDITPEDIEANDAGYITEHQRNTVMKRQWYRWWPFLIPTGIFTLMPMFFMVIAATEAEAVLPLVLTSIGFWITAAAFGGTLWWQWLQLQKDLRKNEIHTIQGIAVVNVSRTNNSSISYLEINGMKLKASPEVLLRVRHLDPYVVNYLPESKIILSMQHVDEDQNIRQDEAETRLVDRMGDKETGEAAYGEDAEQAQRYS
ncbi:MAG: hypothetical protein KC496_01235 [Anaerolineae bacterium]|nr:hypothetical protein [Anaerolineae bacterium]